MTETIKAIVNELGKEPFKKKFTLISFDSLNPEILLQVLNDVLTEIEPANKMDIRQEGIEDTVIRMIEMLRILKYRPPHDDPSTLRSGLVEGDSRVIHPILAWLLPKINELKTRAYLARYLVKVEIPDEIRADIDIEELYQQYEEKIEQFKVIHKQLETMKSKGFTTSEIRKDIQAMESEEESVQRKIEKLKRMTEETPNKESILLVIHTFRKEREQAKELTEQSVSQTQALNMAEQRLQRLQRQLKEIRQAGVGATPEGILQRLEQDTNVTKFIVKEKLPKEIDVLKKQVIIYNKVLLENFDEQDLEDRIREIGSLKTQVNEMVMKRMMKTDDDKLVMFRQQTAIVGNKKLVLIEKLNELNTELLNINEEVSEKKLEVRKLQGDLSMNEEDFKEYVKNLRVKSTRFKQLKAHLISLKSESSILGKTIYILQNDLKISNMALSAAEARLGVKGFSDIQESLEKVSGEKSQVDEKKTKNLHEMSTAVKDLHDKLLSKKVDLAPLVKNLTLKRQQSQILSHEYDNMKRKYNVVSASIESGLSRIVKEVERVRKINQEDELKYFLLKNLSIKYQVDLQRMQDEIKMYTSVGKNSDNNGKKSWKDTLVTKISEQERLGKSYKNEEKEIQERQIECINQAKMWKDLEKMLICKIKLKRASASNRL